MAKKKNIIRIRKSGWWMLQAFFRMNPWRAVAYIWLDKIYINVRTESVEILTWFTKGKFRNPQGTSLEEVSDVEVDQGLLAMALGYGTVSVISSGGDLEGIVVRNPLRVKSLILKAKADAEIEGDVKKEAAHKLAVDDEIERLKHERGR